MTCWSSQFILREAKQKMGVGGDSAETWLLAELSYNVFLWQWYVESEEEVN